ncbi:hypothetical protein KUTeg_017942 [Tegillarca granosa]|uniref:Uncharacterized protein n=1 Tax=Tegillarca granosa TaxID=220873 RepID=A0ABQ9EGE0_TEGGR|nr:hypothetical protein KUTeg_017942 [Tegillarca granosa]
MGEMAETSVASKLQEMETNFDQRLSKLEAQNEEIINAVTKKKNGGGAFFIPYAIFLGLVGIPIFILELSLGQFSSQGPFTCWKYAPIFTGVGYGMFIVSALVSIYYNMIIAWAIYYLFASFSSQLPWDKCGEWSTNMCYYNIKVLNSTDTCATYGWYANETLGVCFFNETNTEKKDVRGFINKTLARLNGYKRSLPSEEYFERVVTGSSLSNGLQDLGEPRWQLVLCYLLAFIFVVLALSKSIKTSGKVWKDAAVQIFFSLSASWGGLIALSSYNRFHNDCLRDAIAVAFGNCLTSVFAGFVIFSYLGYLANWLDVPIDEVAKSGPSLTFAIYPFAVTLIPPSQLWSIIFFLMLITLGFVLTETVTTSLMDRIEILRKYKLMTVASICALFFLLGLTLTTNGGVYMLEVMDTYSGGWNILVIAICECLSLGYVYGRYTGVLLTSPVSWLTRSARKKKYKRRVFRFLDDIELMIGQRICGCFPYALSKYWWLLCWCLITPGLCARVKYLFNPTPEWGPMLIKHRKQAAAHTSKYTKEFVIDPWGKESVVSPNDVDVQMKSSYDSGVPNIGYVPYADDNTKF